MLYKLRSKIIYFIRTIMQCIVGVNNLSMWKTHIYSIIIFRFILKDFRTDGDLTRLANAAVLYFL